MKHLWLFFPIVLTFLALIAFYKTQPSSTTIIDFVHPMIGLILLAFALVLVIAHYL